MHAKKFFLHCILSRNSSQLYDPLTTNWFVFNPKTSYLVGESFCDAFKVMDLPDTFLNITSARTSFKFVCRKFATYNIMARNRETNAKGWYTIASSNTCWDTINKIHILTLIIGIFAMMFNLVIIITTLRSKVLQESVAHVLVANMATGDVLYTLYTIIITTTRQSMTREDFYSFYLPYYCRIVGIFFLIGQFISPFVTSMMTLEIYLVIVYCMKPHVRLTMKHCCVALCI